MKKHVTRTKEELDSARQELSFACQEMAAPVADDVSRDTVVRMLGTLADAFGKHLEEVTAYEKAERERLARRSDRRRWNRLVEESKARKAARRGR
jgi:hypothetical protein